MTVPEEQVGDLKLYPKPKLVDRKTGRKESVVDENLQPIFTYDQLQEGLVRLNAKIEETHGSLGWKARQYRFAAGLPTDGFQCIDQHSKCQGDNRDTYYPMNKDLVKHSELCSRFPILCDEEASTAVLSDSEDDFMIVSGVNHKATNRAAYASLALVGIDHLNSIGGVSDMNYTGSAEHYLGQDDEIA